MGINRPLFFLYLRLFDTVDCSKYTFANDCSQTADLCGQSCKAVYDRNLRLYSRTDYKIVFIMDCQIGK